MPKKRKTIRIKRKKLKLKKSVKLTLAIILTIIVITFITTKFINYSKYQYKQLDPLANLPHHNYDFNLLTDTNGIKSYPNATLGIDVSSHQADIDFNKVKNDGIEFVFIRLGYRGYQSGIIHIDTKFKQNIENAKKAGLEVGIYFFSQAINEKEAIDEANFVIEHIKNIQLDLPIVYDLEKIDYDDNYRTKDLSNSQKSANALAFCGRLTHKGYNTMIYTNPDYAINDYNINDIMNYDIWLAQYNEQPTFDLMFKYWQFTDSGKVDGIDELVDLNLKFN